MTSQAHQLASAFWPGDLAMILRWRDLGLGQQHEPVGVPNALVTMDPGPLGELARQSRVPIAATTANLSDIANTDTAGPAITTAEVQRFVAEAGIDAAYCVNGGISPLAHHLTVVDCTATEAKLVRSGVVYERAISPAVAPQPAWWHGSVASRSNGRRRVIDDRIIAPIASRRKELVVRLQRRWCELCDQRAREVEVHQIPKLADLPKRGASAGVGTDHGKTATQDARGLQAVPRHHPRPATNTTPHAIVTGEPDARTTTARPVRAGGHWKRSRTFAETSPVAYRCSEVAPSVRVSGWSGPNTSR